MGKTSNFLTRFALLLLAVLMSGSLLAQTEQTWTGAVSTDATDPTNWEPQQAIDGQDLVIDSAYKFTNLPVFSGSDSVEVNSLTLHPTGVMTLDFDDSLIWFNVATEYVEPHGTIHINEGTFRGRRMHIEDTNTVINVNSGGIFEARKYFFMSGDGNDRPTAGYLNISGTGKAIYTAEQGGAFGRFPVDTTTGVITLNPMGTLDLKGNWVNDVNTLIAKNQIMAGAGYDVVVNYDEAGDWTYVYIRDKMAFVIEPVVNQFIVTGEAGSKIGMVQNDGYAATTTFEWKYSTTSGSGYQSFSPAVTTDSIEAVFDTPGKYFVICEGDGTKISNEVVFFVGSDKVTIAPDGEQLLRQGKDGAMLTVTKDAIITSVEWKWSNSPGEGHVSFDPAATGDEFTPNFDTTGIFYIICEGKDAGDNPYPSKDVKIKVDESEYHLNWNGSASNSAQEPVNWDPIANVDDNLIHVLAPDTYADSLVFSGSNGNINVRRIWVEDTLATMSINMGSDTLRVGSGSTYGIHGQVIVSSGVMSYTDLRHERNTGRIIVKGNGEFLVRSSWFMMGNKALTTGAYVDIMENGKFISIEQPPDRWCTDTTKSVITITGKGMLQVPGDYRGGAETYMAKNQIMTSETEELVVTYPVLYNGDSVTQITAKSMFEFDIAPLDDQLVGVGEAVDILSTVNDDDRTGLEWKYASTSGGPYDSFTPAETGSTFTGSFDAAGDYYVICEGYASDTVVSSEVMIQVIGVSIAPTDQQDLSPGESGTALTVTETATADSREWKSSTTSGSGYTPIVPPQSGASYTPLFLTEGTYYVVCASTFGSKIINSNEVTIVVSVTAVEDHLARNISLYPNPAQQAFYIDAGDYTTYDVKISDMTGRTVLTREFLSVMGPQRIDLDHKGFYFVRISTAEGTHTVKMLMR